MTPPQSTKPPSPEATWQGPFDEANPRASVPGDQSNLSSTKWAVKLERELQRSQAYFYLWLWPINRRIYISRPRLKTVSLVSLFFLALLPGGAFSLLDSPPSHLLLYETSLSNFFPEYILCVRHGDITCQWGHRDHEVTVPVSRRWQLTGFL